MGFVVELVAVHSVQVQGFDTDRQGNFLFLFQLLFGFGHFSSSILDIAHTAVCFLWSLGSLASCLLLLLLCLHHGLSLLFGFFQAFSLLLPLLLFCRLPLSLIVPLLPSFVGPISF